MSAPFWWSRVRGHLLTQFSLGASSIAYATIVSLIFAVRYLDIFRWTFKLTWMVLAITVAAETAGKALLNNGFATQLRPRKYYTVPKETLNAVVGDVHELINFFVIEAQRILFAENIAASVLVRTHFLARSYDPCKFSTDVSRLPLPPLSRTISSRSSPTGALP